MGIIPLVFQPRQNRDSLGLTGRERFTIRGLSGTLTPTQEMEVEAVADDGRRTNFKTTARLDNNTDVEYLRHGGILPMVLRNLMKDA
jgi:aconitate hydratase